MMTRRKALLGLLPAAMLRAEPWSVLPPGLPPGIEALWRRAFGQGTKGGDAVLVSLEMHPSLPPLRGWRDARFLRAYLEWADRPEQAGFVEEPPDRATLYSDTGPSDWVLLRQPYGAWQIEAPSQKDPIGLTLVKPNRGWNRIRMRRVSGRGIESLLTMQATPVLDIDAAVLVSEAAGQHVLTIYGEGFEGQRFEVASQQGAGEVLYHAPNQINARVPTLDRVQVTVDGTPSAWVEVKRK